MVADHSTGKLIWGPDVLSLMRLGNRALLTATRDRLKRDKNENLNDGSICRLSQDAGEQLERMPSSILQHIQGPMTKSSKCILLLAMLAFKKLRKRWKSWYWRPIRMAWHKATRLNCMNVQIHHSVGNCNYFAKCHQFVRNVVIILWLLFFSRYALPARTSTVWFLGNFRYSIHLMAHCSVPLLPSQKTIPKTR